jgi:membrane protein YdbS with pleckstrin-like domain
MKRLSRENGLILSLLLAAAANVVYFLVGCESSGLFNLFVAVILIFISLGIYGAAYKAKRTQR